MKRTRTELEADLKEAERQLSPISDQLDSLVKQFSESVVPDVKNWVKNEAIRNLEENHTKVNEAGAEFVRTYKADVAALLENMDAVCMTALGPKDKWPHNKELEQQDLYTSSNNDFFSDVFRRAISSLGKVLDTHGLINGYANNSSWRRAPSKGYEYAYHSGFDARNYGSIPTYRELLRRHWELKQCVSRLRVEIEKAKTRDMWDEA
jgi:hypothetical protein